MIDSSEMVGGGVSELLALRIIAYARFIAPTLDTLPDGDNRDQAVAILKGVAAEARGRGSRLVKSQRTGNSSVDYGTASSWFSDDDRGTLRALAAQGAAATGGPVGSFPDPDRTTARMWPEHYA